MMQRTREEVDRRRIVTAATVGTAIEWYDFGLYGAAAALVIGPLFFPEGGILAAFAVFAVGFFVRPLGGFLVGHFGDKFGRKPAMLFTVILMGAATVLIGLLPTYETIGIWAPVLLVLLRLAQGFGAGAEFAGAITYVAEAAPPRKRAFLTSIPGAASALAVLLAVGSFALVSLLTTEEQLLSWGWRLPFLASVVMYFVAIYIRLRLIESPLFVQEQARTDKPLRTPLSQMLSERKGNALCGVLSMCGHNANGYVLNTFTISYVTATLGLPSSVALLAVLSGAGATVVTVPLYGMLSDRIGAGKVFAGGAVFLALYAFPFFWLLDTGSPAIIVFAVVVGYAVGIGATAGAQGAFLSNLFETRYRYTGIAASRELNGMLVAGPTPFIATALVIAADGSPWLVAVYMIVGSVLTILGVAFARGATAPTESKREATAVSHEDGSTT